MHYCFILLYSKNNRIKKIIMENNYCLFGVRLVTVTHDSCSLNREVLFSAVVFVLFLSGRTCTVGLTVWFCICGSSAEVKSRRRAQTVSSQADDGGPPQALSESSGERTCSGRHQGLRQLKPRPQPSTETQTQKHQRCPQPVSPGMCSTSQTVSFISETIIQQ